MNGAEALIALASKILFDERTMQRKIRTVVSGVAAIALVVYALPAEEFGGIEFPQGAASFADEVVAFQPDFSGGPVPTGPNFTDPSVAIGVPDYSGGNFGTGAVSLGAGGRIVLKFNNNRLTGSDSPAHDLHIFEVGSDVEDTFVDISEDGVVWHSVGKVAGAVSSIDIDAFGFTSTNSFAYVRLTDDRNEGGTSGETVGADIDAVGAISTQPIQDTPSLTIETAILVKFTSSMGSTYTLEESTDMQTWTDAVTGIAGDGTVKKFFFEITTPRKYYRVEPPSSQ